MSGLRALLVLAWPVVLARSSQAVIGFSDALMTAPLGEPELAAVTTGAINAFFIAILPMGIAFIVQSFASQFTGRGDHDAARRYAWYGLMMSGGVLLAGVLAIPLVGPVLSWFPYEPAVTAHMSDYLAIRLLALGPFVAIEVLGNWYGGLGNTRLHMAAGMIAMVFNVFLNWLLIEGNLGAPALGVQGAAIASVIASWLAFGFLAVVFGKGWFIPGDAPERLGLRRSELWRMLRFGIPNGLNWFLEFAAFALFLNVIVADLGTATLAAMMVVININSVSFMPAFGVSSSGAILAGQAIGAGRPDDVSGIVKLTAGVNLVWMGGIGAVYLLIPDVLMEWFAPAERESADLLALGTTMLAMSAAWQLFDAVAMTLSETLRAAGDTAWCMWARLIVAWLGFIPAAALLLYALDGDHVAAMLCLVGYMVLLAGLFVGRFSRGAWRDIDLTGVEDLPLTADG